MSLAWDVERLSPHLSLLASSAELGSKLSKLDFIETRNLVTFVFGIEITALKRNYTLYLVSGSQILI